RGLRARERAQFLLPRGDRRGGEDARRDRSDEALLPLRGRRSSRAIGRAKGLAAPRAAPQRRARASALRGDRRNDGLRFGGARARRALGPLERDHQEARHHALPRDEQRHGARQGEGFDMSEGAKATWLPNLVGGVSIWKLARDLNETKFFDGRLLVPE